MKHLFSLFAAIAFLGATSVQGEVPHPSSSFDSEFSLTIHESDSLPAGPDQNITHSIVDIAVQDGRFTTLVAALQVAGLDGTLTGDGPFTVFAPTDEAFARLPEGLVASLLEPSGLERLSAILTYHVVQGRIMAHDLLQASSALTASGNRLPIGLSIAGATITQTDIRAENGVIHVVDAVLIPPSLPAMEAGVSSTTEAAREVIRLAVERGAPLYNRGQIMACASIYEVAATSLLAIPDLPDGASSALRRAVERANRTHSADDRAWRLREGLDAAYSALSSRTMSTSLGH